MTSGWQKKTLHEILQKTGTINPLLTPETEFDYIDVSSISNATFQIEETQRLTGKDAPSRARRLVKTNDILFATIRPTLKRLAIVPEHLDHQVCSTGYFVLRPKKELDYRFVFYYLFSEDFMGQMEKLQKGASYPAVTDGEVRAQVIAFPPLPEQQRIVGILDEAFDGIATAKANAEMNLQNARALFASHLQSVFTQRGEGWEEKMLGNVCEVKDGTHDSPKYVSEGIPFVTQKNIREDGLSFANTRFIRQEDHDKFYKRSNVAHRDILISMIGANRGMACIVDDERVFSIKNVGLVKRNSKVNEQFLLYFLKSQQAANYVSSASKGGAQEFIGLTQLRSFPVPLPPLKHQNSLSAEFEALSTETQRLESIYQQKLNTIDELKKSLLNQAFSGSL